MAIGRRGWLGAHPVDPDRAYAVLRTLGVGLVFWSLGAGMFLMAGGAQKLSAAVWQPLMQFTHRYVVWTLVDREDCYLVLGFILTLAGITGVAGLVTERIWLSLVSAGIDTVWCGYVTVFLAAAQVQPGGGNFVMAFGVVATLLSFARFFLLQKQPANDYALRQHP